MHPSTLMTLIPQCIVIIQSHNSKKGIIKNVSLSPVSQQFVAINPLLYLISLQVLFLRHTVIYCYGAQIIHDGHMHISSTKRLASLTVIHVNERNCIGMGANVDIPWPFLYTPSYDTYNLSSELHLFLTI